MSDPVSPLPPERPRLSDDSLAAMREVAESKPHRDIFAVYKPNLYAMLDEIAALRAQVEAARRVLDEMDAVASMSKADIRAFHTVYTGWPEGFADACDRYSTALAAALRAALAGPDNDTLKSYVLRVLDQGLPRWETETAIRELLLVEGDAEEGQR